jgi:endonuclease III
VKNAARSTKQFTTLMKRIGPVSPPDFPDGEDPIAVLVLSFLMWQSTTEKALTAYAALKRAIVDFNDLRVSMAQETADIIGVRYPHVLERCQRLRATLRDIYAREHIVSLDALDKLGKRDIRKYIESLDGIVPYVASRVLLLGFQTHTIPVDEQLRDLLVEQEVADEGMDVAELSMWLERHVMASEGVPAHHTLQAWVDAGGARGRKSARAGKAATKNARTTSRKTAGKKTSSKKSTARATSGRKTTRRASSA